jgi:hypothetical protein
MNIATHRTTGSRPSSPMKGAAVDSPIAQAIRSSPSPSNDFEDPAPPAQPLEPILFPKLRIYFADFPYLHCSID